ncbi:hypothetical protein A8926_3575 [Saccharopolyspora spinosa]|uniref:Uncharacterized protein n=1 Tax=Saccharopolyspora spinosa TaxID=60894 RepID=A0A2N3XYP0_SACSN|nr:hypothetical protein A8926_3575 [Saccharopolyspora spinosa]
MRTLVRLQRTHQRGSVHASLEAALHLCCHQLIPAIRAGIRKRGKFGETAVELTSTAVAACQRAKRK